MYRMRYITSSIWHYKYSFVCIYSTAPERLYLLEESGGQRSLIEVEAAEYRSKDPREWAVQFGNNKRLGRRRRRRRFRRRQRRQRRWRRRRRRRRRRHSALENGIFRDRRFRPNDVPRPQVLGMNVNRILQGPPGPVPFKPLVGEELVDLRIARLYKNHRDRHRPVHAAQNVQLRTLRV